MSRRSIWVARILLSIVLVTAALLIHLQGNSHSMYEPVEMPEVEGTVPVSLETPRDTDAFTAEAPTETKLTEPEPVKHEPVSYDGRRLPILMYHHVVREGETCNEMTVTDTRLNADLQWLTENGYHTILPRELAEGKALPDKPILITFDDGYRSNYELAYPLLQKYQAKAVISIMVYMQDVCASSFLSWDMCREMEDSGLVEIGSHTYLLHNLDDRNGNFTPHGINGIQRKPDESDDNFQTRVLDDIKKSQDRIEEKLQRKVTFFAYPYGIVEPDAQPLVDSLFPVTVVTKKGTADLTDGLQNLPRWTVTMKTKLSRILSD